MNCVVNREIKGINCLTFSLSFQFFSDIGGTAGLVLGLSIMSMISYLQNLFKSLAGCLITRHRSMQVAISKLTYMELQS